MANEFVDASHLLLVYLCSLARALLLSHQRPCSCHCRSLCCGHWIRRSSRRVSFVSSAELRRQGAASALVSFEVECATEASWRPPRFCARDTQPGGARCSAANRSVRSSWTGVGERRTTTSGDASHRWMHRSGGWFIKIDKLDRYNLHDNKFERRLHLKKHTLTRASHTPDRVHALLCGEDEEMWQSFTCSSAQDRTSVV